MASIRNVDKTWCGELKKRLQISKVAISGDAPRFGVSEIRRSPETAEEVCSPDSSSTFQNLITSFYVIRMTCRGGQNMLGRKGMKDVKGLGPVGAVQLAGWSPYEPPYARLETMNDIVIFTIDFYPDRLRWRSSRRRRSTQIVYVGGLGITDVCGLRKTRTPRLAIDELMDPEIKRNFQKGLLECLSDRPTSDINGYWEDIYSATQSRDLCLRYNPAKFIQNLISNRTAALLETQRRILVAITATQSDRSSDTT
ncbi:hypothetical protein T265_07552 [Opisthorchis viverrini]|uniref:Uncharacterized protein n=1 Tax=Opisthorchis viverrini TaxID=6198 RepID=A0A074ZCJ0_OPIVI|nr:hypothetical protein T265_07552 [Opisthorchis viverrini]KER24878.1 hypothetical protein T265_07552 [Opisthorchis viverrini]